MWDEVSRDIGEAREKELSRKFFKQALDLGARMVRHHNTIPSAQDIIRRVTRNQPVALLIQRELVDKRKHIVDTTAGKSVNQELNDEFRRRQVELREVRAETIQASRRRDEETKRELEEEAKRLEERMEEITRDLRGMATNYAMEKGKIEARIKGMEQGAQKGGRDKVNVSAADRRRPKQQTRSSQNSVGTPVTTPSDDLPHHDTSPPLTGETEWTALHQYQPSPTSSPVLSPEMPSLVASYVQILFRLATHDG